VYKKLSQISTSSKLAILRAAILLLTIAVFVYISITSQRQNAIDLIQANTTNLGQSFEKILRYSMQKYNREEIKNIIQSLTLTDNIQTVNLINQMGEIKYSTSEALENSTLSTKHHSCSGCHINENEVLGKLTYDQQFLYNDDLKKTWTTIPVYNSRSCWESACHSHKADEQILGVIEIVATTADIENTLKSSHIRLMLYSLIIVTVVFLILRYFNQKLISKPISELINGTKQVALGKLDYSIPKGKAEFGELSDAFNRMQIKLKEIQQQLIITEKLSTVGKLSAGVAHEINNPLTGIISFTEGLLLDSEDQDPRKEDYKIIRREALRCRAIVKNLLDYTRQEVPELKSEYIDRIIHQSLEIVEHQTIFSKIQIKQQLSKSLPAIFADAGQIKQVLLNLLINASEAIADTGIIAITARHLKKSKMVEIMVEDTGEGIPKQNLKRIFEPFFSTKAGKTNGLGLSISQEIIKNHHGNFEVESEVGKGTKFIIHLPALGK
jgi:two-component system NtrC family sensor kinase